MLFLDKYNVYNKNYKSLIKVKNKMRIYIGNAMFA